MGDDKRDIEKVGMFVDGPYDLAHAPLDPNVRVTLKNDPLRKFGPFPIIPGPKLKAATNDWSFSPFLYLWDGQPYEDPGSWRRKVRKERARGIINPTPFVSTIGEKWMNGVGSYYGTFFGTCEAFSPKTWDSTVDPKLRALRNFYTSPGKKGGYGVIKTTLNPFPEYTGEADSEIVEQRRKLKQKFKSKLINPDDFLPSGHPKTYFNPNPYFNSKDPDGTEETYDWNRLKDKFTGTITVPFFPSGITKKIGGNKDVLAPLEKWISHDPSDKYYDPPRNIFRQLKKDPSKPAWKPQFGNRSRQQKSTIMYNMKLWVNATNFHKF